MKTNIRLTLLFFISIIISLDAQEILVDPGFSKFTGTVYDMPVLIEKRGKLKTKKIQEFYAENVFDYPKIGNIELDKIGIPETYLSEGKFPGVNQKTNFCMILTAKMTISENACYEFSLHSDDGSILWIDDKIIVDNDGGHQMRMKKDTVLLNKGDYPVKLWYFQGYPDRFGFEFNAKKAGDSLMCKENQDQEKFEIKSNVLFETGSYTLTKNAKSKLIEFVNSLSKNQIHSLTVIGHTDNVGTEEFNEILSKNRSLTIVEILQELFDDQSIEYKAIGKGAAEPKNTNETAEGRASNRRVEIIIGRYN